MNIPPELLEKLTKSSAALEVEKDVPELSAAPSQGLIISMEMPEATKVEKIWPFQKDWICYNDNGDLLCITCVSDDGQAWFIKSLDDSKTDIPEAYHNMLQSAKRCNDNYHYCICDLSNVDKFKEDEGLQKILPEGKLSGKNSFKDYEVPVNIDDFEKLLKEYCKPLFTNPCGSKEKEGY